MNALPTPLSWWHFLPLDLTLASSIWFVAVGLAVSQVMVMTDKARMAEPLMQMGTLRVAAAERIALDGMLSKPANEAEAPGSSASSKFSYEVDGTSLYAIGPLGNEEEPIRLAFNPAIDNVGAGWSVLWLCGLRRPPPGWSTPAPPVALNLAREQIPFVCRDSPPR